MKSAPIYVVPNEEAIAHGRILNKLSIATGLGSIFLFFIGNFIIGLFGILVSIMSFRATSSETYYNKGPLAQCSVMMFFVSCIVGISCLTMVIGTPVINWLQFSLTLLDFVLFSVYTRYAWTLFQICYKCQVIDNYTVEGAGAGGPGMSQFAYGAAQPYGGGAGGPISNPYAGQQPSAMAGGQQQAQSSGFQAFQGPGHRLS